MSCLRSSNICMLLIVTSDMYCRHLVCIVTLHGHCTCCLFSLVVIFIVVIFFIMLCVLVSPVSQP